MRALVAFDLDGVLYSSEPFLGEAYREAIAAVNAGRPGSFPHVPTTEDVLQHVGWPVSIILERLFPQVDATAVALLNEATLEVICARVARGEGHLFADVTTTLDALRQEGVLLAVASNGRRRYVETVLATYGLTERFVPLLTIDADGAVHTKADVLRAYRARHGVPVGQLVMVGDRASDVEAAGAAGYLFVGCDYGHGHRDEIVGAGPIIATFADLPTALAELPLTLPNAAGDR
jgi:phosphoglycolate phosphatase